MKKKKEIEIPETKYIYQRYNGIIIKYIVDEEYYIAVETGIAYRKDDTGFLGEVSENIIDLIEEGDYVNGKYVAEVKQNKNGKYIIALIRIIEEKDIQSILTHEQYEQNCFKIDEN